MTNRYEITLDKPSWIQFWQERQITDLNFATNIPESGMIWNEVEEDIVITSIFNPDTGEDKTVEILRNYSRWLNTRD